jgi:uncharacterized protein
MSQDWEVLEFDFAGFEWHDEKAKSNRRKHGVGFEEATRIFETGILARHEIHETEDRYVTIGLAEAKALVVVFTQRGETIRIISARKATPSERRRYGAHFA